MNFKSTSVMMKLILVGVLLMISVQAASSSKKYSNKPISSLRQLAIQMNEAFLQKASIGNLKMLKELKLQLAELRQQENSDQVPEVKIIKMNKNTLVQGEIVVKKDAKFDRVVAKDNILVSENLYSKTIESAHIESDELYMNTIHSLNSDDSIIIQGRLITKKLTAGDKANIAALRVNGQAQWQIIEHEDFESHDVNAKATWSLIEQNSCESLVQNKFNGGYCKVSTQEITKVFKDLPEHSQLKLSGTLHAFDNWEGEKLFVNVNGKRVWSKNIDNSKGISVCGNDKFDQINIKFEKILLTSDREVEVTFGSELKKDSCDASFAIDDIILSVR